MDESEQWPTRRAPTLLAAPFHNADVSARKQLTPAWDEPRSTRRTLTSRPLCPRMRASGGPRDLALGARPRRASAPEVGGGSLACAKGGAARRSRHRTRVPSAGDRGAVNIMDRRMLVRGERAGRVGSGCTCAGRRGSSRWRQVDLAARSATVGGVPCRHPAPSGWAQAQLGRSKLVTSSWFALKV